MHEPADQRLADSHDQLHGFDSLHHPDHARQHAKHATLRAARHHPGRRRLGIQAAIAGTVKARRKDGALALEPEDRAIDVRLVQEDADVVREIPRRKIVRAIDDDVVLLDDLSGILAAEHGVVQDDMHVRIDVLDPVARAVELLAADILRAMEHLALEIRVIDDIEINEPECADPRCGKIKSDRGAKPARPNAEHFGRLELLLPFERYLRHDEMPRITGDFIIAELDVFEPSRIQNAFTHISKTAMGWIDHFSDLPEDCKTASVPRRHRGFLNIGTIWGDVPAWITPSRSKPRRS